MKPGERQVAPTRDGIRRDHTARYEWLLRGLDGPRSILDVACGVGYGSQLLGQAGHTVLAVDCDEEAIRYARTNYPNHNVEHKVMRAEALGALERSFDLAVMFECVEHIADPLPVLRAVRRRAIRLIASVPNEEVFPWDGRAYHFRHYTLPQFRSLLASAGWRVDGWTGQHGPESEVEPVTDGRTLIAQCSRDPEYKDMPEPDKPAPRCDPLGTVAILGLGPSVDQYTELTKRLGGRRKLADETWGINALGDVYACDIVFHMDDIRVQMTRAEARPESNIAAMVDWMRGYQGRVITSFPHPEFPSLEPFPLEEVVNDLGGNIYFNSTAAYAVAYAIWRGAKKIMLFGCDFTYPNSHDAEKGRGCVEFWLGYAMARGIKVAVPKVSSLMDACYPLANRVYGFDMVDVRVNETGGKTTFAFVEKAVPPTADEIEAAYDHGVHPNPLVSEQ